MQSDNSDRIIDSLAPFEELIKKISPLRDSTKYHS